MTLTNMQIGILPYDDGSGYRFTLRLDDDDKVWLEQGSANVILSRDECRAVMDALDALWATADEIAKSAAP